MSYLKKVILLMTVSIFMVGCSFFGGSEEDSGLFGLLELLNFGEEDKEELEDTLDQIGKMLEDVDFDELEQDLEEGKLPFGIEFEGDAEIPEALPPNIPFPDDYQIEMSAENEWQSQVFGYTQVEIDELEDMYTNYLENGPFEGGIEREESQLLGDIITLRTQYDGYKFEIVLIDREDREVHAVLYYEDL